MSFRDEAAAWLEGVIAGFPGGITALAKKANVPRSTLYGIKKKEFESGDDILKQLATAAGVPIPRRVLAVAPPSTPLRMAHQLAADAARLAATLATIPALLSDEQDRAALSAFLGQVDQAPLSDGGQDDQERGA